jgi:hypothetical protein
MPAFRHTPFLGPVSSFAGQAREKVIFPDPHKPSRPCGSGCLVPYRAAMEMTPDRPEEGGSSAATLPRIYALSMGFGQPEPDRP